MAETEGNYQTSTNTVLTGALNTTTEERPQKSHNARNAHFAQCNSGRASRPCFTLCPWKEADMPEGWEAQQWYQTSSTGATGTWVDVRFR